MYDLSMHVVASYLGFWGGAWVQGYHKIQPDQRKMADQNLTRTTTEL